ncbi:hypothetical protein ACWEOW_19355 [Monashia sp. NPDC004114]
MALLGVILLLAGIGAGVYAYVGTHALTATTTVTAFGFSREATPLELVGYGVLAMLLFALGWALLTASARRRARARRLEREDSRVAQLEERSASDRLEHDRRFEEAGLRDEDLRRREAELAARHEGLNQREAELSHRESAPGMGAAGAGAAGAGAAGAGAFGDQGYRRTAAAGTVGTEGTADTGLMAPAGTGAADADPARGRDADVARSQESGSGGAIDTDAASPGDYDAEDQRTAWTKEAPADSGTSAMSADEPPARPAETRGRPHDAPHQTV